MLYTILKFIHVLSMAVWVGGLVMMLVLNRAFTSSGDAAAAQALGRQGGRVGPRLFMPAMIVTLLTGIGMVHAGSISWGSTWIIWGILGLVGSIVIGGALTGATARKLGQAVARGEIDAAGVARAQRKLLWFALINLLLLATVIYVMVAKPA